MDRFREATHAGPAGHPRAELLGYLAEAAEGIDYLNEPRPRLDGRTAVGIQHRDIKPQNILLVGGGVKVADFGLARPLEHSARRPHRGHDPAYAAPEFFRGQTATQSDQYSLAVTYCHLRGGRLPFTGVAGRLTREPDLTMIADAERPIIARAMDKEPKRRWPDCKALVDSLRTAQPTNFRDSSVNKHSNRMYEIRRNASPEGRRAAAG